MMTRHSWSFRFICAVIITLATSAVALKGLAADQPGKTQQVIKITAQRFHYTPNEIRIKKGVPVILEFTSLDRVHGFSIPDLNRVRLTIEPGKVNRLTIMAPKAGVYEFHCDIFCGEGHEGMTGKIIVED